MSMTVRGRLKVGLVIGDQTYRDFELRPGTLRDTVEVVQDLGGDESPLMLRYAAMARRLKFDGLSEPVTAAQLLSLYEIDAVVIEEAHKEVEKKLEALSEL